MNSARRRFSPDATKDDVLEYARETPLVCATIFAKNKTEFLRKAARGASLGCDLVELRIDHLTKKEPSVVGDIIQNSLLPLIVTIRSERDGGLFPKFEESARLSLLNSSLENTPTLIDIEFDLRKKERSKLLNDARKQGVGVICSHHDFNSTPPSASILSRGRAISEFGADIAKQAYMVRNQNDASRIIEGAEAQNLDKKMFTTFGMGHRGRLTRLQTLFSGSCLIYCSIDDSENRLGQIGVKFARKYIDSLKSYEFPISGKGRKEFLKVLRGSRRGV
ncbi:MAG: type I 3-dehydroquinate dehydratase [Nitrososphaerota archaeon]|nr:type I 3-dehydroquinate dehydratase [Nitrososphaerota archaeon]MDG6923542.1 type I 3-dehydroquinate dehydratase [Nitrososphaerota archaeon]